MGESVDSKSKKIKTEAGTRINASYKTNMYQDSQELQLRPTVLCREYCGIYVGFI